MHSSKQAWCLHSNDTLSKLDHVQNWSLVQKYFVNESSTLYPQTTFNSELPLFMHIYCCKFKHMQFQNYENLLCVRLWQEFRDRSGLRHKIFPFIPFQTEGNYINKHRLQFTKEVFSADSGTLENHRTSGLSNKLPSECINHPLLNHMNSVRSIYW